MNSIPSVFNQRVISRSVIGGHEKCPNIRMKAAVVLLNRQWSPSREKSLGILLGEGFEEVISVELNPDNYSIEDVSRRFPSVKFIIPLESVTDGDLVNICASEVKAQYFLILRDTLELQPNMLSPILFERLVKDEPYCVVPRLTLQGGVSFPIVFRPSSKKSQFEVESTAKVTDGGATLYPFDGIALFNRRKFVQLGGYDYTIENPYWQTLDLAFRSWLWGESTRVSASFAAVYGSSRSEQDISASQYSNRFFLKNLAPIFVRDHGELPRSAFFRFLPRSSCGFIEALSQFLDARSWVSKNRYRFRLDAVSLVEKWS